MGSDLVVVTAQAFLEEFGLDCGARLEEVASRLGLRIQEVAVTSFEGALLRVIGRPVGTIAIRKDIPEAGRKRFTLAHELGHYLLPNQQAIAASPCGPSTIETWDRSVNSNEIDANRFAAEVLMPRPLIREMLRREPSLEVARTIASRFDTSLTAATFRLVELSSYRTALVMSDARTVRWYRASDEFARAVRTGPLDRRTLAHDLFVGGTVSDAGTVSADAWLYEQNLVEGARVWEHSVYLRSYNAVLTLLEIRDRIEKQSEYDEDLLEELDPEEFTLRRKKWPSR